MISVTSRAAHPPTLSWDPITTRSVTGLVAICRSVRGRRAIGRLFAGFPEDVFNARISRRSLAAWARSFLSTLAAFRIRVDGDVTECLLGWLQLVDQVIGCDAKVADQWACIGAGPRCGILPALGNDGLRLGDSRSPGFLLEQIHARRLTSTC